MKEIQFITNNNKPNLRSSKKHIITFGKDSMILYNLKGDELDIINFHFITKEISDICIINDNYLIVFVKNPFFDFYKNIYDNLFLLCRMHNITFKTDYLSISINNNCFKLNFIESLQSEVKCFSYLKNINVLILSFAHNIKIFEINSLRLVNIQTIDNYSKFLNFNKNIFIAYDKDYISIYKKIDGIKNYQLLSKLYLINYKAILWLFGIHFDIINLLKLDNTNIFAYTNNYSYLINVKKMKIIHRYKNSNFSKYFRKGYIFKIKNKICIFNSDFNIFEIFEYCDCLKKIYYINSIYMDDLTFDNFLIILLIEEKYPFLKNKIKFEYIDDYLKNKDKFKQKYLDYKINMIKSNENKVDKKINKKVKLKKNQNFNYKYKRNKIKRNQKIFPSNNKFKKNYR